VQSCPTEALIAVKIDDAQMAEKVRAEKLVNFRPEIGAKPRIWYKNFDRVTHCFLGGALVRRADGKEDCAAGVTVRLLKDGVVLMEQQSDAFGEFKFEPLEDGGQGYRLQVLGAQGLVSFETDITLNTSQYLGVIELR
jgi:hypothetical protein